jgi:hypothetical protein
LPLVYPSSEKGFFLLHATQDPSEMYIIFLRYLLARKLIPTYLFYVQNAVLWGMQPAFFRENAGFDDFLDYDDSSADFNFSGGWHLPKYPQKFNDPI